MRPDPVAEAALHGIAGDVVRTLMPHTESGEPAILLQFLVAAGAYLGRTGYYLAEGDRHHTNLFAVIVGATGKGRKGTSWGQIRRLFKLVDDRFVASCIKSGLSTGEGLIWAVRDEIRETHPSKEKGHVVGHQEVVVDAGIPDKRLLVQEPEFARLLRSMDREANSASAVIREAWDSGTLSILTKNKAARATAAHIAIIGHITSDELRKRLASAEAANGFANRFLWVYTQRSKVLPFGGDLSDGALELFAQRLRSIYEYAQTAGRITFDDQTADGWRQVYGPLSSGKPGLLGAVIGRAEAQVVRLATLYALLDCDSLIRLAHLQAALSVWDYCEASAAYIFGDSLGDGTADAVLGYLRTVGSTGATRTEISVYLGRNKTAAQIACGLETLSEAGLARSVRKPGEHGRPVEFWLVHTLGDVNSLNSLNSYLQAENTWAT